MKDFFGAIQYLFENVLFIPYDAFRAMDNWWSANVINWILIIIGFVAVVYWIMELKKFDDNDEEDKSITAHSYL